MEEIKVLFSNENGNPCYHDLQQTTIAIIRVKLTLAQVYIKKEKKA